MVNSQPYPIVSQLFETHISILIVDDADSDRLTYSRYLQSDSEKTYRIIEAATLEEGLELWRSQKPDIILLDLNLPDGNGLGFLEAINVDRSWENVPVIVLTGSGDEKKALQAIKLGATDYLVKGDLTAKSLSTAVKQVLQESWLKAQLQRSQQQQILIAAIALRIREFTDLDDISNAIVKEVRQFIKADRATIYKFNPADMSGKIVAEDIVSPWQPCLNVHVEDTCFRENLGGAYCEGRIFVANDIYAANLTACHIHLLERFQVRANLVVPILLPDVGQETLWGLLILHQCAAPRIWLETDIQLLQQLAVQLSISIQQAIAYQKVQADLVERKRFENLLLKYQADLEERNDFLESTTEDLQCTVEELRVSTEDLVTQHRQLDYEQIRYQNLFNFAPNGYLVTDTSGRIIEANQTILSLLAIDHEAILGQLLASFIDSYHLEFFYKHLNSLLSQNKLEAAEEFTIVPLQGKPFPAEIIATRNITADSNSIQLLWIVRNISDRKRAEEELLQLNQTLEAKVIERTQAIKLQSQMLEQTHDSVISTTLDGTILTWNIGAEKLYEYEQNEAIGKNVSMLYLNEDLPLLEATVFRPPLEKENHEVELRNRTKSGKIIYIGLRLSLVRDALGKPAFLIGCSNNISDRKLAEESLRESEQRFANLAATAPVAIFQINQNNECTYVNEFWTQITGQESSIALGYGWLQTIHPDDREQIHQQWTQAIEQQVYYQNEGRCIRPDGTICCYYCQAVPVLDEDGVFKGYIGTLNDISDRKQAEIRLKLANQELLRATKLKDEFLANMSHELRTPLNAILGLSESLLEEILGSLNEKQLKAIATVESSGEHLLSLINDILDLSKVSSGMMTLDIEAVSVKSLCDTSLVFINQQAFQKNVQIDSHIPPHINNINIDERRIKQVLINLLTNSVKFTPSGGKVSLLVAIGIGNTWQGKAIIPQRLQNTNSWMIVFQVVDTGIGIASKDLRLLFQPFVQVDSALNRQYEGTGLGLALVKQIVELHGGQVIAESGVGQGSRFTVALPYEITTSDAIASASISPTLSSLSVNPDNAPLILLAEDNEANIHTFSSYLTALNYRVIIARDGEEAVAMAKANSPDIIIMDTQMPTMDGLEATKQIRLDPDLTNIPIIALTALAMEGDRERCLDAGANEYLSKPIKLKQLANAIQQFLIRN